MRMYVLWAAQQEKGVSKKAERASYVGGRTSSFRGPAAAMVVEVDSDCMRSYSGSKRSDRVIGEDTSVSDKEILQEEIMRDTLS